MNPDLQAKLVKYLDAMESAAQKATDFAATEVPEAIREWLLWLAIERFGTAALFLALAALAAYIARRLWRSVRLNRLDETGQVLGALVAGVAVGFGIGFGYWTLQGVKVLVAPRVVLVEQVAGLAKSVKP